LKDEYDLQRFVEAQEPVFKHVREELGRGRKTSHWMWFVFPQVAGLGLSPMSQRFAISSLDEAAAYLHHPILGPRLRECVAMVLNRRSRSAREIFGSPDDMKFRSCLTLFDRAAPGDVFATALAVFFDGVPDAATLDKLPPTA
jgi:uncharacterized protein (DUF1810 family)